MTKTLTRVLLLFALVLPFAACKKQEAPKEVEKAPLTAPSSPTDDAGWKEYLKDVVTRNMDGITNAPYVYMLPPESAANFSDSYDRLLEKAKGDVARGIISGNLLAYGGPSSTKMADLVDAAFKDVPPNTMKGVKVLFIGNAADSQRVQTAVAPAGVDYKFIAAK